MSALVFDDIVRRLTVSDIEPKNRLDAAVALRDSLDNYTSVQSYPILLKRLMPAFINILKGPCIFQSTSLDQKLRNCVLEIFHRLPMQQTSPEPLEPYAVDIVDLLMTLVKSDNEENATLCVKVISDIMRHQPKALHHKVQAFLDLIQELFQRLEGVVREQLDNISVSNSSLAAPSTPGSTQTNFQSPRPGSPVASVTELGQDLQQQSRPLLKGIQSFKVVSECPIIVVSIFQTYRNVIPQNVKAFVPLIKSVLSLQVRAQEQAHAEAKAQGKTFAGVSANIKNRAAFGDFITAQVKTMSFLAYLLRQYSSQLTDFLPTLPEIVVRLLQDCPREKSAARKELLVAIRHIINFNFRKIFLHKIDELLDEKTLIGDGLTVYDNMRPLAYSMLADLIHHVRESLSPAQIQKTVEVYTKNLQDNFPGTSFQTMSAKLLLNMADCIARMQDKVDARHYLLMILNAIGDKFAAMNRQYPNAVKLSKLYAEQTQDQVYETYLADKEHKPDWDETDIFTAMPIKTTNPRDRAADPVVDNKFLFKNLINGLKNTFFQLKSCNTSWPAELSNLPQQWQDVSYGFSAEDVKIIVKLFREGAYVFRYYEIEKPAAESHYASPVEYMANFYMVSSSKEEKDLLETFATVFHCIDPATFHEVFQQEIPRLYEMVFEHTGLLHIPQFFLASEATSPSFCGMLLQFLMKRIHHVGSADVKQSSILLRLFKLAFMAVTLFANQNEQVLLPHVVDIVTKSIELSTKAEEPMNYFLLLRSLFRSIGGGKFELLYKQILPLLEMVLEVLNNLLLAARRPTERDLYVELCLTVPARLSNLLPHLSYLMRPLVVALRAGTDLVGQGLRTLELCVDNLQADYLDPIMAPVIEELMNALFEHLKPHPYSHFHAHTTMRILGKLGGRNRKFMSNALPAHYQTYADDPSSFNIRLIGSKKDRAFRADLGIDCAIRKLMEVPKSTKSDCAKQADAYYKRQSFQLIKAQLKLRVGVDSLPDDLSRLVRLQAEDLLEQKPMHQFKIFTTTDRERSVGKKDEQDEIMKRLIKAVMYAASIDDVQEEADLFLLNLCRHFAILEIGRGLVEIQKATSPFDVEAGEGPLHIDTRVLCDAIVESLASDLPSVRDASLRAVQAVHDSAATVFGPNASVSSLSFFTHLSAVFCHACYAEEWFMKSAGSLGIRYMLEDAQMGDAWVAVKQVEFVRALMHVIKDMPQDLPENTRNSACDTLNLLLELITKEAKKEDALPPPTAPQGQPQAKAKGLAQICSLLNDELCHMNRHVRRTARRSLEMIAAATQAPISELIEPYKEKLMTPIYAKPLRALPFSIQIGYIDAVTYYMCLRNEFVPFDENLNRLLMESLALADAGDESLAGKPAEFRTRQNIVELRVACIKILSKAMTSEEFAKGPNNPQRVKIVAVFFKCLYSESDPTIEAANESLRVVLQYQSKLPKDLLQGGLRPVLANLQEPKRLTTHGLDNLARLLRLLTTYFKVEIGARLLSHIKVLTDSTLLRQFSFTFSEQHPQMRVIAAVFNIFHLLPPAAEQFKDDLIATVLDLEERLRRTHHSSFRTPLYKYIDRYPQEIWTYLLGKLESIKYGRFLAQVLRSPEDTKMLRAHAAANVGSLLESCHAIEHSPTGDQWTAIINTINILDALSEASDRRDWLQDKGTMDWLKQAGKKLERRLQSHLLAPQLRLAAHQAGEQVMALFTQALALNPSDIASLLSLVESVTNGEFRQTPVLLAHIYDKVICSRDLAYWRSVLLRCLDVYASRMTSQSTKCFVLHNIVNPIVAMDVMRNWDPAGQVTAQRLIDRSLIEAIAAKVWKVNLGDPQDDLAQPGIDHTRMEVLQLSAMLVKYHHAILQDARKDIIKFGWTYIRLDDVINKHAAYVVIGYFIAHYETPAKIVTQVYYSLLRANQNEGRLLVTQALELMAPVLPKRCTQSSDRNAVWAMAPRRVLAEESQNVQQMTMIFQFLVRHADLFYESRGNYALLIITSLRKVSAPQGSSNEHKKLALKLMWLIWQWEQMRVEVEDVPMELSPTPTSRTTASAGKEFEILAPYRLKMVKYLVEFIASLNERHELPSTKPRDAAAPLGPASPLHSTELCTKAMSLLYNLLQPQYWGDLDVDLFPNVTDVVLASERTTKILAADPTDKDNYDEKFITNIINTLQVVRIIVNFKTDDWIVKNITSIQKVLEKCLKSDNPELQDCLHFADKKYDGGREMMSLVGRILAAIPDKTPMDGADAPEADVDPSDSELIIFLSTIASEALAASNYVAGVNILWSLGQRKPSALDSHVPHLMKALQTKLAREHVNHYQSVAAQQLVALQIRMPDVEAKTGELSAHELEIQTGLMIKAIQATAWRMEILGESRRPFLSVLASLVEKSQHNPLCQTILDMVEDWVFRPQGSWPTLKEKTAVLSKMLSFENRVDPTMLARFLELVIRIYEDPKITRSELTVRMEQAFLIGTRAQDFEMRNRFMSIFDKCLSRTARARFSYVVGGQNWDTLQESYWLAQASQLLLGGVEANSSIQLHEEDFRMLPTSVIFGTYAKDKREPMLMADDKYDNFMANHRRFALELGEVKVRDIIEPLMQLQHVDSDLAHELWVTLFPLFWSVIPKDERLDLQKDLVVLLTKEYHSRQIDKRPNVVQSLLAGAAKSWPQFTLPPHVMKFAAKTYDAWYTALVQLEHAAVEPGDDSAVVRESNLDALLDLYSSLKEEDLFYGTWRRRAQFVETNSGLSYEQNGMWEQAQKMYETAQIKARQGVIPFSQAEYMLWEDHWVLCAEKLQQWDILQEFSKQENLQDLLLECAWRNIDMWQDTQHRESLDMLIKGVMDAPTPRRAFFQGFMALLKMHKNRTPETQAEFHRVCDEAIQLSIRKWHQLPSQMTAAHVPMLHNFQQLVELHDASVICQSLASTNQGNLDAKSSELKLLVTSWRERLPNMWDDITDWHDLVTWRQHIFGLINSTYLGVMPQQGQNVSGASFAYRGFHETAWIINRFAHVCRKHHLAEVCINQLSRIYTLPNIEIQEAFLKLREQAKCHYESTDQLNSGLEVINNTNLNYFNNAQKAEFFTLKGMFLEKLGNKEDADAAYGTALYYDISKAKAWAEWGYFNDRKFKEDPTNLTAAKMALVSYLQAIGSYKNNKARRLIARILWLLSMDDAAGSISSGFDDYKGEQRVWYWITFIPQLLTGLGHKEAPRVHGILLKIARSYPQSLYFQLRTNREDMLQIKKTQEAKEKMARQKAQMASASASTSASPSQARTESSSRPQTANSDRVQSSEGSAEPSKPAQSNEKKPPWEHTEEIMSVLKTAFPLLALSMETMVDQIQKYFKCPPDEDAYRLIVALLNDGLAYVSRMPASYAKDVKLPAATEANITRFAETILPSHIKSSFDADFVSVKPTMYEYIHKLRKWRDKFEERLDRRNHRAYLEAYSRHLSEFRYQKFDDVEVPGQYLEHKDKNQDFIRIQRFLPNVDLVRVIGVSHRRIKMRGHDGSVHSWAVQHPAARHCRREERILQLFRHLNHTLAKRKETRRRDLQFTLPLMIPLAPHIRIVQEDTSYVTLQSIYEDHCRRNGAAKDGPVLFTMDKLRGLTEQARGQKPGDQTPARIEVFSAIQHKWVPHTMALEFFEATFPGFADFWLFRRRFSYQLSSLTFMTYVLLMTSRYPHKFNIARGSGKVWGSELLAFMSPQKPYFTNPEPVPFRLTPNLQTLMGPLATEGIFSCAMHSIARCLTERDHVLEHALTLFVRDEVLFWFTSQHRAIQLNESQLRDTVQHNCDTIIKRAVTMSSSPAGHLPVNQTTIDLIQKAVNPVQLALCDALWMPYL